MKKRIPLIVALVFLVVAGVALLVGLTLKCINMKTRLSGEYYGDFKESEQIRGLTADEFAKLAAERKSFVILVTQAGCATSNGLKKMMKDFLKEKSIRIYEMDFSDLKKTDLYKKVKYYPSVVIVREGGVAGFLRADSDEDAPAFNNYGEFKDWLESRVEL